MPVTCVVIDDEPHARDLVQEFLADYDHVSVAGTAGNGREGVALIREVEPDLVFLDVQMPGLDGFDVLERLDTVPYVIFSTAYDEYALRAFETGAVDYLLKPYSRDRFRTAVERVTDRLRDARPDGDADGDAEADADTAGADEADTSAGVTDTADVDAAYLDKIAALLQEVRGPDSASDADDAPLDRLYVRHGSKIVPVDVDAIRWIEAAGDYAKLHTDGKTHVASLGLGDLAERLPASKFQRVHRSHVVALSAIDHLRSDGSGGYVLRLDDGTRLRVSRSYASEIRDRIV